MATYKLFSNIVTQTALDRMRGRIQAGNGTASLDDNDYNLVIHTET